MDLGSELVPSAEGPDTIAEEHDRKKWGSIVLAHCAEKYTDPSNG